jgi:hypothetical protein
LATFSGRSDELSILRWDGDTTFFIDNSPYDGSYWKDTEVCIFLEVWDTLNAGPYDLLKMPSTWGGYPPPNLSGPPYPELLNLENEGRIFVNGDIEDTLDFTPKLGETWCVGDTNYFFIADTSYLYDAHTYVADSLRVPQIDMSLDYWRYQGAVIVDRLTANVPDGWEIDENGYHWTQEGANPTSVMDSGLYYFSDLPVMIDTAFTADGNVRIVTPFSVVINRDVTYSHNDPKSICFMAGEDIILGGDVLVKAVLYAKSGDLKVMNQAVILGAVIVGGHAIIGGRSVVILDEYLNVSGFHFVDDDKRYVSTVLSWREVRP